VFGYGQNAHKDVMRRCLSAENLTLDSKKLVRPVGYAAYIVDYGLLGVVLLMVIVFKSTLKAYKTKFGAEKVFLILWILSWSLVTNDLDHLFVYIVLLLNYFGEFKTNSETVQK
jgi:hypothetical protein